MAQRARTDGVHGDPVVRKEIARLLSFARANDWAAAGSRRRPPARARRSLATLAASEVARRDVRVHARIASARVLLTTGAVAFDP